MTRTSPLIRPIPQHPGDQAGQQSRHSKPILLFILSPSFSGSTLLTFLLASHPEIATIGELKASALGDVSIYRCSCGALLEQCEFWTGLRHEIEQLGTPLSFENFGTHFARGPRLFRRLIRLGVSNPALGWFSEAALRVIPAWRKRRERIVERNRLLIELITARQRGKLFLDGSKDPEQLQQLLKTGIWNVKVLHLLRDGRGTVNSYMKHHRVDLQEATLAWLATLRACMRVISRMAAEDVLTVKYEEICQEPRKVMNRIFTFTGLRSLAPSDASNPSDLHILGNAMRLSPDKSIKHDDKWKTELDVPRLRQFEALAGDCNRARGYSCQINAAGTTIKESKV
jgi:hypothetical protein